MKDKAREGLAMEQTKKLADKVEGDQEFQRVSKKNDPRWAGFTEYIAVNDFEKDQLGIKAFEKMSHPEHIMALFKDNNMKKRIVIYLNNKRNKK